MCELFYYFILIADCLVLIAFFRLFNQKALDQLFSLGSYFRMHWFPSKKSVSIEQMKSGLLCISILPEVLTHGGIWLACRGVQN